MSILCLSYVYIYILCLSYVYIYILCLSYVEPILCL